MKMPYQHRHVIFACDENWNTTKCGAERICGADQNGDNLRINRAYLRISDYCGVTVSVSVSIRTRLGLGLRIVVYRVTDNSGITTYRLMALGREMSTPPKLQ